MSHESERPLGIIRDVRATSSLPLLGEGVEASVYALDRKQVLRRYKPGANVSMESLRRLGQFYGSLNRDSVPFAVPDILAIGEVDSNYYTVDRRIDGEEFIQTLGRVAGPDRERALMSYIHTAEKIQDLHPGYPYYGEVLADKPVHEQDWPTYIRTRLTRDYDSAKDMFDTEIPDMPAVLTFIDKEVEVVADTKESKLIHVDYYVLNVLADEKSGEVSGVLDFNDKTLAGDPRMNIFSSLIYLFEGEPNVQPRDGEFVLKYVTDTYGKNMKRILHLYRLYYAIRFASYCKESDPYTFNWSIRSLKEHLKDDYKY